LGHFLVNNIPLDMLLVNQRTTGLEFQAHQHVYHVCLDQDLASLVFYFRLFGNFTEVIVLNHIEKCLNNEITDSNQAMRLE
jgi:hypothetical protein